MRDYLLRESSDGPGRRGPGVQTVSLSHIRFRQSTAGRDPESQREENESARDVDIESSKVRYPSLAYALRVRSLMYVFIVGIRAIQEHHGPLRP